LDVLPDPAQPSVPEPGLPQSAVPGTRTFGELDALLARAGAEVQRGLEEGHTRIGRYTLVSSLGEGGFGTVWLASQEEPVRRLVALKVLRRDPGSRMVLARFQNERQALARMDHVNVASVLDAGVTDDGRPWFVMPYIDGQPITQHCDAARLPLRDRVELLLQACDGVQHAHQKGIIHRDLKPGNLMVARSPGRPLTKVIDFGVAKALEPDASQSMRTVDGQRLGTPQYMPPEQWLHGAGVADVRSDVYALGVVLGELLAGGPPTRLPRTPLDGPSAVPPVEWLAETSREPGTLERVAAARGCAADALVPQLQGDLDAIVRRATATHPEDRYPTVAALADDLRRWLDGRPVAARVLAPWEALLRFVKRRRVATSLGIAATVAVTVFLALWVRSAIIADRAAAVAAEARAQRDRSVLIAQAMVQDVVSQYVAIRSDPAAATAAFRRVEGIIDRLAGGDPLVAGRLAAVIVDAHANVFDRRSAQTLVQQSMRRVLEVDPRGESEAFAALASPLLRLTVNSEKHIAPALLALEVEPAIRDGGLQSAKVQESLRTGLLESVPWPAGSTQSDIGVRLALADLYASPIEDPRRAATELALHRLAVLSKGLTTPDLKPEAFAAYRHVIANEPAESERRIIAELQWVVLSSVTGDQGSDLATALQFIAARAEHAFGTSSPKSVNAYWNLACTCAGIGAYRDGHMSFLRFLWPEVHRRPTDDGLRRWYLAYFVPIAYEACDFENAYAAGMQLLADDWAAGRDEPDSMAVMTATGVAGALAELGDEAGAVAIERTYGVRRAATPQPEP
jgi:hypothetical protein